LKPLAHIAHLFADSVCANDWAVRIRDGSQHGRKLDDVVAP